MSSLPDLSGRPSPLINETLIRFLLLVTVIVICGPLCLVLGAVILKACRERQDARVWVLCGITAALGAIYAVVMSDQFRAYFEQLRQGVMSMNDDNLEERPSVGRPLAAMWLLSLPLGPLGAILAEVARFLDEIINGVPLGKSVDNKLRDGEKELARQSRKAAREAAHTLPPDPGYIRLGPPLLGKTEEFPAESGVVRCGQWVALTEKTLDQHLFILGATGSGKSVTLTRIVWEILHNTERDVIWVDGKGEEPLAIALRAIAYHTGRGSSPIFRMGLRGRGARYNGFSGDAGAIYSRLVAMSGVMALEGNADIFGRIAREVLQLICNAPEGPPRSFDELRRRLTVGWLQTTYKLDKVEGEVITSKRLEERLEGVQTRLRPLIREFSPLTGSDGFTVEESRASFFVLRSQSMSDTASHFLQFLIEDLKDFIGKRQQRPTVLVIDEFGAFGNQNVIKLLNMARSANLGVILATQDVATLGDESTARQILAGTTTKFLMRSDFPEDVGKLAGTVYRPEASVQYDQGKVTGLGSVRIQDAFRINMNEAAQLNVGEGFLIRHRRVAKLKIGAVEDKVLDEMVKSTPAEQFEPDPPQSPEPSNPPNTNGQAKKPKKPKNID